MKIYSEFLPLKVKAGASLTTSATGTIIEVLDASLPAFFIRIPGRDKLPVCAGLSIPADQFTEFSIENPDTTNDLTVLLHVGTASIGDRRAVKNAPTYAFGAGGVDPSKIDGNGLIQLSKVNFPNGLIVKGVNNGNRRFQIVLTNHQTSNQELDVQDLNGNSFMAVKTTDPAVAFYTDTAFLLKADNWNAGGSCLIRIGELYYAPTNI